MSAGKYDLYIEQGATFLRSCIYKDQDGNPVNLTGYALNAQIRRSYSDNTITQTINIIIADQAILENYGKFSLSLTAIETASIPVNPAFDFENTLTNYTWDLEATSGTYVSRILQGSVFISPEVTK